MAWMYVWKIQEAPKIVISVWGFVKMAVHGKFADDLQFVVKGVNMKFFFLGKWSDYKVSWWTAWWFVSSKCWF